MKRVRTKPTADELKRLAAKTNSFIKSNNMKAINSTIIQTSRTVGLLSEKNEKVDPKTFKIPITF